MSNVEIVKVNDVNIQQIVYNDEPVVTFKMIAAVHKVAIRNPRLAFQRNKKRFVDGKHYFHLDSAEARRWLPQSVVIPNSTNGITLLTRKGYALLIKSLNDDTAWTIQEQMIDEYFTLLDVAQLMSKAGDYTPQESKDLLRLDNRNTQKSASKTYNARNADLGGKDQVINENIEIMVAHSRDHITPQEMRERGIAAGLPSEITNSGIGTAWELEPECAMSTAAEKLWVEEGVEEAEARQAAIGFQPQFLAYHNLRKGLMMSRTIQKQLV